MSNNLKTVTLPDSMGIPLQIGDWVTYSKGVRGIMTFGKIEKFNECSMIIAPRKGKQLRLISAQVVKIPIEQLTLYWFSL